MERPPAPPEAALIRLARQAANIRMAKAAKEAGVSLARWSHIENAYETRQGTARPVKAKADTLARMARAIGLSPERLESEGQRPDAAEILREMLRPAAGPAPPSFPEPPTAAEEARERFPGDQVSQAIWRLPNTTEAERWEMIATLERKRREIHARKSQAS